METDNDAPRERSSTSVISCEKLSKRFGAITAVNQLSFGVGAGEIVGFLGPNGAGKTTTLRVLMGFIRPSAGSYSVLGKSGSETTEVLGRIGFLPGDLRIDPAITGAELFRWFGKLRGGVSQSRVAELVEKLELDPTRPFRELSRGNRQKIGLVQAFMSEPEVLILDEPTSGLDPILQQVFQDLLREAANNGAAILFSSHALHEVEQATHRVIMIKEGQLVRVGPIEDLLSNARQHLELRFAQEVPKDLFKNITGVVDVRVDGASVSVTVDGPVGELMRAAVNGGELLRVRDASDGLEEVFLSLYKKTGVV